MNGDTDTAVGADTVIELPTVADTEDFGARIGAVLRAGDLVLLAGPLGAGKTALTRGIAAGLGVSGQVASPTFVIARVHPAAPDGRGVPLVHVDAYRLGGDLGQLDDLDLDAELLDSAVVVEWGEGTADRLHEDHLIVRLDRRPDEVREAVVQPVGDRWTTDFPE